ncbi:MAG: hypothetical protein WC823_03770 [Parcubacteria group bacterium]|jgi:hypothetical protein
MSNITIVFAILSGIPMFCALVCFFAPDSNEEKVEKSKKSAWCYSLTTIVLLFIFGFLLYCDIREIHISNLTIVFAILSGIPMFFALVCFFVFDSSEEGMEDSKKNAWHFSLITMILFSIFGYLLYDDVIKQIHENSSAGQMEKITDMQVGLRKQIENISKAQSVYQSDIEKYSNEIKKEKEAKHITSYAQASERMKYNIQLIREVDAYNTEIAKIKQVTENGLEETIYKERRLNAKFLMAKTIGDGKVLSQEVDGLLKKYSPLMDQYVIDPKKLTVKSPEEIWEQIGK